MSHSLVGKWPNKNKGTRDASVGRSNNEGGLNYLNTIFSNGAYCFIDKSTRVTNVSQTTLDHFVTNYLTHILYPFILFLSDLTDHYSNACRVTRGPNRT